MCLLAAVHSCKPRSLIVKDVLFCVLWFNKCFAVDDEIQYQLIFFFSYSLFVCMFVSTGWPRAVVLYFMIHSSPAAAKAGVYTSLGVNQMVNGCW